MKTFTTTCSIDYAIDCCEKLINNGNGEALVEIIKQYKDSKSTESKAVNELNKMLFEF
jgi:hypothetical protein